MKKKNRQYVGISLTVKAIMDKKGNVIESRSMVLDISKRKIDEQKLKDNQKL